jgi:hypothetical protein
MDLQELLMLRALRIVKIARLDKLIRFNGSAYKITDYFKGLEKTRVVERIFGERTREILENVRIEFTWLGGYMWVNNMNGHIMISSKYLNTGSKIDVYLDIVHELVHVRQFMEGKELFDSNYDYVERPTEIEAYRYAVEEARNLGLDDKRICEYLKTEWMNKDNLKRLANILNVKCKLELNDAH